MTDSVFLPPTQQSSGSLPDNVQQAIAHVRAGVGNEADRQVLIQYLATGNPDPTIAMAIGNMIGGLGGGSPTAPAPVPQTAPTPQIGGTAGNMGGGPGTDWVVEAQNQGVAPTTPSPSGPNLPGLSDIWNMGNPGGGPQSGGPFTGSGPAISGGVSLPTPGDIFAMGNPGGGLTLPGQGGGNQGGNLAGRSPQFVSPAGGLTPPGAAPDTPPVPMGNEDWKQYDPTHIGAPVDTSGVISPSGSPLDAQAERVRQRMARGKGRGGQDGTDWAAEAGTFGLNPNSQFFGTTALGSELLAQNPDLAAQQLYGDSGGLYEPQVNALLGLSAMGMLSGHGRHKGIGGGAPTSNAGQLQQMEAMLGSLGPGEQIDPGSTYHSSLRRLLNTPEAMFATSQGGIADIQSQVDGTKGALLTATQAFMTPQAADLLSRRIDIAAKQWQVAVATGQSTETFPQYLKSHGAGRWVSQGG